MVKKVAIAGAGPAGLLLAHYLLLRGDNKYKIDIYERRSDPRKVAFSKHRTYPISLFERGLSALRIIAGLEEKVKAKGTQIIGIIVNSADGKTKIIPRNKALTLIDRTRLVISILDKLEKNYSQARVKVHFNSKLIDVNFENNTATIKQDNEEKKTVNYDILVGADGAKSIVRSNFIKTEDLKLSEKSLDNKYKMLFVPRINEKLGIELAKDKMYNFTMASDNLIIAVPQPGDILSCVVNFDRRNKDELLELSSTKKVIEFFDRNAPKLAKLITLAEAEKFLKRPLSNSFVVSCNRYHQNDNVVIIGDAAHALFRSLGQGCNSALEDVVILNRLLEENNDDWAKVLPQFTSLRVPDIKALQELSNNSFPKSKLLLLEFIWRRKATQIIKKIFPNYQSKFMFDLLETTTPYSEILRLSQNWVNKVKKSNQKMLKTR